MLRGRFGDWDGWMDVHLYSEEGKQVQQVASVILSPFNLMSDFAIRLGHARAGLEIHRSKSKCD